MISAASIDELLPQTQCGQCGYPGCLPYAQAIAAGQANIGQCPPGGASTVKALATLLQVDPEPYIAALKPQAPAVAHVREAECIGCTKCIQACPVDAIIGSAKQMHQILEVACTGCGLCVEPCPVDCIEMLPQDAPTYEPPAARLRYQRKLLRSLQQNQEKERIYQEKRLLKTQSQDHLADKQAKQAYILEALQRKKTL
ncbi:MAG: RnfABCDGE type electron transport complex subunit B [Legionellaceae bacterium]|nr:RnfABCDGE type electron transport complex subunit B [Legionellaceae bacterium]